MNDLIYKIFFSDEFLPHEHCYLGNTPLVRLHLFSDLLIALAYYSIPLILLIFLRKRKDLPFRGIFYMFGAFILACGTTHILEVWTLWYPAYWLSGAMKAFTAALSIATAIALVPLTPKALSLRGPSELEALVEMRTLELSKANEELQKEIAERKRIEKILQRKTDELERSNKDLEQFAYIASHDLQEPLYVVAGFADTIKEQTQDKLDSETLFLVNRIQKAAERMRRLIADLLDFARVNIRVKPFERVDLNEVVQEVLSEMDLRIQESQTQIHLDKLPFAQVDRTQIAQLFQNLFSNAIKFKKKDQAPVLTVKTLPAEEGYVNILVQDNGIGFDQEYADRILEPFQRLHARGEFEGSGLGLAICQKIVSRHGGKLSVKGQENEGASFIITLPSA